MFSFYLGKEKLITSHNGLIVSSMTQKLSNLSLLNKHKMMKYLKKLVLGIDKQHKSVILEIGEMNKVSSTLTLAFCVGVLSERQHLEEEPTPKRAVLLDKGNKFQTL